MKSLSILCKRNILNDFQTTIIYFQTVELFCKTLRPLGRGQDAESKFSKSAFIQQPLRIFLKVLTVFIPSGLIPTPRYVCSQYKEIRSNVPGNDD